MPTPPTRGRGGSARGASRGRGTPVKAGFSAPQSTHITTIGVKRPNYGSSGRALNVSVNAFPTTVPEAIIHHYDVVISPSEKTLPARLNMELINELQTRVDPQTFTPRAVYDGRKNLFAIRALPLGEADTKEFTVPLSGSAPPAAQSATGSGGMAPKAYKIRLTKVAEVNPEVLNRFVAGDQSHDNAVLTAITALNVVIRMYPSNRYPFNVRSFFTDRETKDIPSSGLQLWRGYFQSVRPAIGRMLINVDISTGAMYKSGPLLNLCLEFLGKTRGQESTLSPVSGLHDRDRLRLQRFIAGIRVVTKHVGADGTAKEIPRVIKKVTTVGAKDLRFNLREGGSMSVADYFQKTQNRPLRFPHIVCVEVGSGALIPLELCEVKKGQIMRKQVPADKIKSVLDFATKRPEDRLQSILNGREVLAYGQSEYVRQFGMKVNVDGALKVSARILNPPVLRYGVGSKQPTIKPNNGSWNMVDKRFFRPATITGWAIVVFENQKRFSELSVQDMISGLTNSFREVGIMHPPLKGYAPIVKWANPQGRVADELRAAGTECMEKYGKYPTLLVVILPEGGNDIYTKIKHFGDVVSGVATQCLKSSKCYKAKPQYYANVSLKINVKLGGINTVPDPSSVGVLTDPHNPTIVMGADVVHPSPGSEGKPSFTALVGNVDSDTAKYVAVTRVQTSRQEIIGDLKDMATDILTKYRLYRQQAEKKTAPDPKRIIFYRDGVSEGQFQEVLDKELAALKSACKTLQIDPKITIIVVGKRHHVRFFPQSKDADRSGNCPAGTVVDSDIAHPVEFDFYLQSHGGLLGTSRPAHYSILYDENNFSADALQSLSFALCHVYARSTRSVSIPAPVYYADIVCARAKNHYDPDSSLDLSETASHADSAQANASLDAYRSGFRLLHLNQERRMYFS